MQGTRTSSNAAVIHVYDYSTMRFVVPAKDFPLGEYNKISDITPLSVMGEETSGNVIPVEFQLDSDGNHMQAYAKVSFEGGGEKKAGEETVWFYSCHPPDEYFDHYRDIAMQGGRVWQKFWKEHLSDYDEKSYPDLRADILRQGRKFGLSRKNFLFIGDGDR